MDYPVMNGGRAGRPRSNGRIMIRRRSVPAEVLFEMRRIGRAVRVNAIDPRTGIEVTMVGDARAGVETLKRNAARKLAWVLEKRRALDRADR